MMVSSHLVALIQLNRGSPKRGKTSAQSCTLILCLEMQQRPMPFLQLIRGYWRPWSRLQE
jgi:hypothetical protein